MRAARPVRSSCRCSLPPPGTVTCTELPLGTTAADVAEVVAIRQPMDPTDNAAPVTVTSVNRAFFLGPDYLPGASFLALRTTVVLTPAQPTATLWAA